MTEYIRQKALLPSEKIDRLIAVTPSEPLTRDDFERLGFNNWQDWLDSICSPASLCCEGYQTLLRLR